MKLSERIAIKHPELRRKLYVAGINLKPEEYVGKKLKAATQLGILLAVFFFLITSKGGKPNLFLTIMSGIITAWFSFKLFMKEADAKIAKRAKEIDKDVLFAGRFLLVKLNSGTPLINALEEATKSYGVANDYFKQIVRDIDLGTPLEKALEKATLNCPSEKMKKILFQITNALKIGTDVTDFLEAILDEIADQQLIEIKRYGKKLNSLTMFYMLLAIVLPSLGMTMIVVIVGLLSLPLDIGLFLFINVLLIFLQFIFVTMFRAIRPNVNI